MYLPRIKQALGNKKKYDLVDFRDHFIRVGTKKDAKKLGLFTRSVHIILTDKHGKILICKRPSDARRYPSQITSSAGGHVEQGESYKIAAIRELKEELGIKIPIKDLGRFDVINPIERAIHHLFIGKAKKISINSNEIATGIFLSFKTLKRDIVLHPRRYAKPFHEAFTYYSTVTLLAKLRGRSTSRPKATAI